MRAIAVLTGLVLIATGSPASATTNYSAELDDTVIAAMLERSRTEKSSGDGSAGTEVNVQRTARNWAFGSAVVKAPKKEGAYPSAWLFIATKTGKGWRVALDGTSSFAELAAKAPSKVMSNGEKATFARNAAAQAEQTNLALPYTIGKTWKIIGGLHGWSGQPRPWSSIDLDSRESNREVLSAQSGRAYWMCGNGGHIRVVHDNGWTTEYYHLLNEIRPNGDPVKLGDYLGLTSTRIPCGGSAGSNHVHFAIKRGGSFVQMAGKIIGGWDYFEGSSAYGGGAIRNGVRKYVGDDLRNYGTGEGRTFHFEGRQNIPDLGQAEVPIEVSNAQAGRVKVYLDIHHTWIGDLEVDLISPSGTAYRLRNADPDNDADLIHKEYTVDASGTVNGTWKLRAKDVERNDSGYIDATFLTF